MKNTGSAIIRWLNSDQPGAAHAFAGTIIGGTFLGIVGFSLAFSAVLDFIR